MKNTPSTVIGFVNAAHFIDHYAMLVFAAAVIVMAPTFGMAYGEMLPYATPGFIAFGAGSLAAGWLGDRWSRRHMMLVFFLGMGAAMAGVGLANSPGQLSVGLLAVGLFASIYHPVGTAMLVGHAGPRLGREIGINGVWGNLGVASSALVTGLVCQYLGWRWAFILPGITVAALGLAFAQRVRHEAAGKTGTGAAAPARVPRDAMRRVVTALVLTVLASSTTFNAITVAIPKLFAERLPDLSASPALVGGVAAGAYVFGALAQYLIGNLIDRHPLKTIFLPLAIAAAPLIFFSAQLDGALFLLAAVGIIMGIFGQVTVNDAMIGKYTSDEWRARAYSVRYFLGFTAAGASIGLVAWLHEQGGFSLLLQALGTLGLLVIAGAFIFPREPQASASPAVHGANTPAR